MNLDPKRLRALVRAACILAPKDFLPYLHLRTLLSSSLQSEREEFRQIFRTYYGLNEANLSAEFFDEYFGLLFGGDILTNGQPNYISILLRLYAVPSNGRRSMQFSFVSKLVAIHHEDRPIVDRHVLNFFDRKLPAISRPQQRATEFVQLLTNIALVYDDWAKNPDVSNILQNMRIKAVALSGCHYVRLLDFLVWKVGNAHIPFR